MIEQTGFIKPSLILPREILSYLSPDAVRLYGNIWNLMRRKDCDHVWLSDRGASIMSRIDCDNLQQAKQELVDVGLFTIKEGKWPLHDKPNVCNCYRFATDHITTH